MHEPEEDGLRAFLIRNELLTDDLSLV